MAIAKLLWDLKIGAVPVELPGLGGRVLARAPRFAAAGRHQDQEPEAEADRRRRPRPLDLHQQLPHPSVPQGAMALRAPPPFRERSIDRLARPRAARRAREVSGPRGSVVP